MDNDTIDRLLSAARGIQSDPGTAPARLRRNQRRMAEILVEILGHLKEAPAYDPGYFCEGCGSNPCICNEEEPDPGRCTNPAGHSWVENDDGSGRFGEGRVYCEYCGADGDG